MAKIIDDILSHVLDLTRGLRVLYVGVGNEVGAISRGAQDVASVASEWHGIEIDPRVPPKYPDMDIRLIDLNEPLPADLPVVDIVVMTEVLEHLESPVRTLRALRSSFPGARLVGSVPNALSMGRVVSALWSRRAYEIHDGNHMLLFNRMTLRKTLSSAGLSDACIYPYDRHRILAPFVRWREAFAVGFFFDVILKPAQNVTDPKVP
jgi:hypothetical protein